MKLLENKKLVCIFFLFLIPNPVLADWILDGGSLTGVNNDSLGHPKITMTNDIPYVICHEYESTTGYHLYVKHLDSNSWVNDGGDLKMNLGSINSANIEITTAGKPYAVWIENANLYSKHFTGIAWLPAGSEFNELVPANLNTSVTGNMLYACWNENNGVAEQVYVKHFDGFSWISDGGSLNLNGNANSFFPNITHASDGTPYVVWSENAGVGKKIYVKYFDSNTWIQVGSSLNVVQDHIGFLPSIAVAPGNVPYVAWEEWDIQTNIFVKYFDGVNWVPVGSKLNTLHAENPEIVIAPNGTPYVTYNERDISGTQKVYVKYYSGTQWVQLGSCLNIDDEQSALYPEIAITSNNIPYVVWYENKEVFVKHYDPNTLPTPLPTSTATTTPTPTVTITPTATISPTPIISATYTATYFVTQTPTPTITATPLNEFEGKLISKKYTYTAPNPIRGDHMKFVVHVKEAVEIKVKMYTTTNKFVLSFDLNCSGPGKYEHREYVGNLANGAYLLLVKAKNSKGTTDRLIKKVALIK